MEFKIPQLISSAIIITDRSLTLKNESGITQNKICERCKGIFECNSVDIKNCACSNTKIPASEMVRIKLKYKDCLCINCLEEIKKFTPA